MDNAEQQIVDSIKNKSNILVTVSTDPSVDELSAALGLTILLNNLDKRATAIASGTIPPAIDFLEPGKTFENNADSLRDFIIALDKEKADHLRYKVEGDVVKIFITPYRTKLSEKDLEFSQGDYNVELVIALGVRDQDHLDKGLEAHGKILHDATVVTITSGEQPSNLGSVDWHDAKASSLSEMIVGLAEALKTGESLLDQQISTALLTGIVSATDRFSNDRTSSRVMTMAAQLMAAGANQQLIAAKLEEAHDIAPGPIKGGASGGDKDQAPGASNELTIKRSDDKPKPQSVQSSEAKAQLELEKQLAGLTAPSTGTMADIEKELQDAAGKTAVEDAPPDLIAVSDATMPGFEPTQTLPPLPPEPPVAAPQDAPTTPIINEHGSRSTEPSTQVPPINSIQNGVDEGEPTVDPFTQLPTPGAAQPSVPSSIPPPTNIGTPEGAALLGSEEPVTPPVDQAATTPTQSIPQLPPLPPLPSDSSLPPLPPPPPPPPTLGQDSVMPAGAIPADQLGDIFGDANSTPPVQPTTPPEPGQFKIPGQK